MSKSKFTAGIIGLGVGEAHVQAYLAHPECRVKTICDINTQVLNSKFADQPQLHRTTDPNEVLTDPDIDVVTIASYDDAHYEQILTAIAHDKHLFVEKPICMSRKEADIIVDRLQEKPHLKFSSNLILRQSERFRDLAARAHRGELGEIYAMGGSYDYGRLHKITEGWRGQLPFYSVLFGGGVHIVDLLLWISQRRVTEVFTVGTNVSSRGTNFRFADCTMSTLRFEDGLIGRLGTNFGCVHPHFHQFEVFGTKGTFLNRLETAELWTEREGRPQPLDTPYPGVHKGDLIADFLAAIDEDREPIVGRKAVFDSMAVCFGLEDSLHSGRPETIAYYDHVSN